MTMTCMGGLEIDVVSMGASNLLERLAVAEAALNASHRLKYLQYLYLSPFRDLRGTQV